MPCKLSNASLGGVWGRRRVNGTERGYCADAISILRSFSAYLL